MPQWRFPAASPLLLIWEPFPELPFPQLPFKSGNTSSDSVCFHRNFKAKTFGYQSLKERWSSPRLVDEWGNNVICLSRTADETWHQTGMLLVLENACVILRRHTAYFGSTSWSSNSENGWNMVHCLFQIMGRHCKIIMSELISVLGAKLFRLYQPTQKFAWWEIALKSLPVSATWVYTFLLVS